MTTNRTMPKHTTIIHRVATWVTHHGLLIFCAMTIALSFAATQLPLPGEVVPIVMVFIPTLIALSLTAMADGWSGVRALLGRLTQWRVRPTWIVIALALGLILRVMMSGIAILISLIPSIQLRPWTPVQLAVFAAILFIFAIPEELGWRGYALPKLLKTHSPLVAGLMIGVAWGSLHLALTVPGMIFDGMPLLPVVLEVAALAVLGTWLYIRSSGNILLTSLFHAAQQFFVIVNQGITMEQQLWLMAAVFVAMALVVVIAAGPRFVRKPEARAEIRITPPAQI